jgi:hypothetical protein
MRRALRWLAYLAAGFLLAWLIVQDSGAAERSVRLVRYFAYAGIFLFATVELLVARQR